jgi:hypothetical protein
MRVYFEGKSAMEASGQTDSLPLDGENGIDTNSLPGIIAVLGELKPGTVITEEGMAYLFQRHVVSVKRAVQRGELPPPCRLFGANVWTAGALVRYIESRLEQAAKDAERETRRLAQLSPASERNQRI